MTNEEIAKAISIRTGEDYNITQINIDNLNPELLYELQQWAFNKPHNDIEYNGLSICDIMNKANCTYYDAVVYMNKLMDFYNIVDIYKKTDFCNVRTIKKIMQETNCNRIIAIGIAKSLNLINPQLFDVINAWVNNKRNVYVNVNGQTVESIIEDKKVDFITAIFEMSSIINEFNYNLL